MSENTLEPRTDELTPALAGLDRLTPRVDVYENADGYLIRADVPGVTEDDIDIRFDRGELVLQAKRTHATDGTVMATEFGPSLYRRAFRIPERVESDRIEANLGNGVLQLVLPKAAESRPRRIAVQGA